MYGLQKSTMDRGEGTSLTLKAKLKASEKLVAELTQENQEIKKEVKLLAQELEELHDTFREDQVSEFRDVKRELEATNKNFRVLQFKLKKSERLNEQLAADKTALEKRVNDMLETSKMSYDKQRMRDLENELSMAKEVIADVKAEKSRLETALLEARTGSPLPSTVTSGKSPSTPTLNKDYEEVVRSLCDTMEREKDLQEQLKFAEEENRTIRKKLTNLEQENDILMAQIKRMANKQRPGGTAGSCKDKGDGRGGDSGDDDSDELNVDEMKLQLELYEQEIAILRKKSDEVAQENDNLSQEIKYLQEKLVSQPLTKVEIPEIPPGSPPNVIYEHKIRILETEARDLRKKLVDREKEVDNLRTEVEVHRRKASKVMVRSRSLESEAAVDLKRQLQLVEQEASILRQKIITLENENEKLTCENKRLQLRVSRRPPPSPVDQLQIENIELKAKISDLEKRCDSFKGELVASKSSSNLATIIQDFKKPLKEIASAEKDVIAGLRKQIAAKEDEEVILKRKIATLETEISKLTMENRKTKEMLNYKKTPMRVIKESATRLELKEICRQMEDEISKLQISLNAKEKMNENLEEELAESKKGLEMVQIELRAEENKHQSRLSQSEETMGRLKAELEEEREKVKTLTERLDLLSKNKSSDVALASKVQSLEGEKKQLLKNICSIESELVKERSKSNESKDKLATVTKERKELVDNNKRLEEAKRFAERELTEIKGKLNQSQKELTGLMKQLEVKQEQIVKTQEQVGQLKEQLDEERRSTSFTVSLKPKATPKASKEPSENEGLIKQIADLESKNNNLERELERVNRDSRNKESTARKELEKLADSLQEELKQAKEELASIRSENASLKVKVNQLNQQIEKITSESKETAEKHRKLIISSKREKDDMMSKLSDSESQLRLEQRRREKAEKENDLALKGKEEAILQARERIYRLERELKRMEILTEQDRRDNEIKLSNLNREIVKAKQEYDDLTSRYEVLEQEFVSMKSKLLNEKDNLMDTLNSIKRSYDEKSTECKSLNHKQEDWIKEKLNYQEKLSEMEARMRKGTDSDSERSKLRIALMEKEKQLDEMVKREKEWTKERTKLKEMSADSGERRGSTGLAGRAKVSKEMQEMKNRMDHAETSHRGEVAALRAEYESRMKLMRDEITLLLSERDQLRARAFLGGSSSHKDEMEDMRAAMETLRAHLEQALLETRNLKIEHAAEKSSWQIQVAELKTRLNQADEQSLMEMSRGSTRSYAKTRLELAWEKERQENQKLLTDTQRMVEEMKKRVISLEIAREKERTEAREQLKEMKVIMDKEQEDTQKRIGELQLDLIDLRDSHARMRSQNDRLKRERLTLEKEREEYKLRMFTAISIENKVTDLCHAFDVIMKMLPSAEPQNVVDPEDKSSSTNEGTSESTTNLSGLQRRRSRKRPTELNTEELRKALEDFKIKIDELSKITVFREGDPFHRTISFRRAMSSAEMNPDLNPYAVRGLGGSSTVRAPPRPKALAKKSLSLDQTMGANGSQERIWDSGDESVNTTPGSSMTNLRYPSVALYAQKGGCSSISGYESESSYGPDSSRWTREGSYGSDVSAPAVITSNTSRPKKSLFGLLKKTHSIENTSAGGESNRESREKKESSLRSRISKTLKKTLSRSSSSLTKESRETAHDNEPVSGLRSLTSRTDGATALPYRRANSSTLGPTVKPPLAHDVSTSRGLTRREPPAELNNIRSSLRSVNSLSRSTRV